MPNDHVQHVSNADIRMALHLLAKGKATGNDCLGDRLLHDLIKHNAVRQKIKCTFAEWLNGARVPAYITTARVIFLSKEQTPYPAEGNVRTIAILPAITKLYELVLHRKLIACIKEHGLLHAHQRGFVEGGSTLQNIHDVVRVIKYFQARQQDLIHQKVPKHRRPEFFLLYLDLRKAFDSLNRDKLMLLLFQKTRNHTLTNAIRALYSNTCMTTQTHVLRQNNSNTIKTERGVMLGGVLSPTLFALYINDLLIALNVHGIAAWALADDIVVATIGQLHLMQAIHKINTFCREHSLTVNKKKSGIMVIRQDNR